MRFKKWLGLVSLAITLAGCSINDDDGGSTNNNDDNNNDNNNTSYIVQAEIGPPGTNIQYGYYDTDLLKTWTSTFPTFGTELTFTYNDDFSVQVVDYIDSEGAEDAMSFQYDFEGKLIGYIGFSEEVTLEWNDNIVTVSGTIEGDATASAVIELDGNGRVVKFTESNQYITLAYDSNGNLTSIFQYDLEDNFLNDYSLMYDSNPNPFFGQLNSIYLERFLDSFWEFDGISFVGLEGYSFPFQSNNIIQIQKNGTTSVSYGIAYDNNDYPVIFNESSQGESFQYSIIYE